MRIVMNKARTNVDLWMFAGIFIISIGLSCPAIGQDLKKTSNNPTTQTQTPTASLQEEKKPTLAKAIKSEAEVTKTLDMTEQFQRANTPDEIERIIYKYKPDELAFNAVQKLARPHILIKDWETAARIFKKFKPFFPNLENQFKQYIKILTAKEEGLRVTNLGSGINTPWDEYHAVLSANGSHMLFSRDRGKQAGGEDIYASVETGGQWNDSVNLGPPVSTSRHENPLSISADGNTLVLSGNYPGSLGRGDIFYCTKKGGCWSIPKPYPAPINSEYFESDAMLTADGRAILFVSSRPGGVGEYHEKDKLFHGNSNGNTDIYVYITKPDGKSELINLGKTINTPFAERTPFLHPDGKTLYFSSDGHAGLGGLDVFVSTRLNDKSWTEWSEPINLGKEINGPDNDWGYQVTTKGDLAYIAATGRDDSRGGSDIYSIAMPEEAKPWPVTTITGKVTDPDGHPLAASINWNDLTNNQKLGKADSNAETGEYFIALPAGRLYSYYAEKDGYFGESEQIDLNSSQVFTQYFLDITLFPIQMIKESVTTGEVGVRVNNIFFDYDKFDLKKESFLELDRWVAFLTKNSELTAEFQGHTDSMGTDEYNQTLSEKRAQAVIKYLNKIGIAKTRLTAKGYGESRPVADNVTDEGRSRNRRVEVYFGSTEKP